MKVFLLMCWCDGFGNDGYVYGIYSSYDLMIKKIENSCKSKIAFRYFEVNVDECDDIDFDYYLGKEIE